MLSPRLALVAAALLVVPALAFTDGRTGSRTATANVASDANSYLKDVTSNPTLTVLNLYQATAITVTHHYANPSGRTTTFEVTATKTAGDARFVLTPASGTISRDGSLAIDVKDTAIVHTPITGAVTIRIDATIKTGGSSVGFASFSRSVTVTV